MSIKLDDFYNLRKSFAHAFRGIVFCIRYERNMRIHIVMTGYVMFAALQFYELPRAELVLLILTCVSVMSLEIINTAIEVLTDKASPEYSALAKAAKDAAAGAVLLSSLASIAIGVVLLWDIGKFGEIASFFGASLYASIALILSMILSCIFVFTGKERRKRGIKKEKQKGQG
ncbi:MAG: diacylglycerol kinase family protein [Oscillospiraceae bacterium]|nr:diacylglycerol kinase family protein [Oscillospiraceae bacterium]